MIDSARLCELEASVAACGSGANIGIVQFEALMGRKWCEEREGEDGHLLSVTSAKVTS